MYPIRISAFPGWQRQYIINLLKKQPENTGKATKLLNHKKGDIQTYVKSIIKRRHRHARTHQS
ncbi:hypothetical protein CLOSTASPAR_02812 [[Clostridium] asparagiforme DSM 15981]|uniref:Uncharacterized protein n=1 Tax=[Clostridium] asparagiforme DSM 15981 TaxID=518636 RepID=C0D0M5_9FIRM|nr:hypothetical protein CLOSTASPAR_02812 [[Clostridium] asparagiforme DSM 15981]